MTTIHWYQRYSPRTLAGRRMITGYIFISPFILGFLLWFLIPAVVALWLTVHDWNLISPPKYVGLKNIERMFTDKLFWQSLKVTLTYTLVSVPLGLVLGFILALLLNAKTRGITVFRTVYYLPSHRAGCGQRRALGLDFQHRVWVGQCGAARRWGCPRSSGSRIRSGRCRRSLSSRCGRLAAAW